MNKVRWGILSTAKIGTVKVIPAMQQGEFCEIAAIASRNLETAKYAATDLGIPKAYGSYEELLDDPDIDAIYNPLPNHLHVEWSIKALDAGKHVLCEKPIGLTSEEGQQLVDAGARSPHLKLMEAFMYRHHPQWKQAKTWVEEGKIGELRTVQTNFSYFNNNPDDIRNQAGAGGGGLMDIGCYPISLSRFLFDAEPNRVFGLVENDPDFQVDRLASVVMEFGRGTATFTCSTQLFPYQRVNIFGTEGRIEIEIPFNAPPDEPCKIWLETEENLHQTEIQVCDQYTIQGDLFSQAILEEKTVPTPITDAVANMRVIEAIRKSSRDEGWTSL
ncbi:Glucose--fructose oxidoreductase precursor [Polystyrenella longa]|uniref:Glucose--fructose oxidoreductase n=1 Tax=Polystyrenella longa TaxID=2528007 RepID=A0A518CH79_9PLAN|nr:Gfo/Idh/MocA family oxidoreductase [Polystyrenella longa]QDU78582.1 Glucose--fructose oxidoreductase precursor [Polystyrenella longa]